MPMAFEASFSDEFATPRDWACLYRSLGLQVIPSKYPREDKSWKRPIMEWAEFRDALTPDILFDRWYGPAGEYAGRKNMGLIMGLASGGAFCVDLDIQKQQGARQWWADLLAEHTHGQEPNTPAQKTGGGGRQLIFRAPEGWSPPTFKTSIGIDIRGQGGFMVAPPSAHQSGTDYDWEPNRGPWQVVIQEAELWLIDAIESLREQHGGAATGTRERAPSTGAEHDAFGLRIDGREEELHRMVWGAILDMYRESPIPPPQSEQDATIIRLWDTYATNTKSRLYRAGMTNAQLLELEGRGRSELVRKWRYAMRKWSGKVAEEAAKPNPNQARETAERPTHAENDVGDIIDPETGEILKEAPKPHARPADPGAADGPPPDRPGAFPDIFTRPPGLVGDIIDWIEATARYPQRSLALPAALAIVGTIAGRKYATPTQSGTHLYTLALAPTGAGKNHAPKQAARLLRAAGFGQLRGPGQYMSMSGVFSALNKQPRHLSFIDEFGGYMARIASSRGSPHERAVKDILRTAWGASFEELRQPSYADGRHMEPIISPCLSIYGMSTPEEFYGAIGGDDIFNGFLNRFLIIRASGKPRETDPPLDEFEVPSPLLWGLAAIKDRVSGRIAESLADDSKPMIRLEWGPGAREAYVALRQDMQADEKNEALLSRVAEMSCRLATIRAIGIDVERPRPIVRLEDMEWGREVVLWSARQMVEDARSYMSETENQARAMLFLRLLRDAPDRRMSRQELVHALRHKLKAREINEVMEGLIEAGEVGVIQKSPTSEGGRTGVVYVVL